MRFIFSFANPPRHAKLLEMFRLEKISSFDQPELAPYRTMRRSAEHEQLGIFVAESEKVVRRLLASRFTVVSVVLPAERLEEFRPLLAARTEEPVVYLADRKFLETLTGISLFQGILAIGKIPPPAALGEILAQSPGPKLLVAVDAVCKAENLGALVRNCVAFGVQALLVGETSSSPFLRRAVRNSMGAIFQLPVVESKNLAQTLRELRARGIRCVAAHPRPDKKILSQADFTGDCCVVFGNEGDGISPAVLASCDEAVAIPMPAEVDSLNVGAAAAVFLYEANRQRGRA
jgi:tRNA G18 (ribose-2'-O)-methylase SpoU